MIGDNIQKLRESYLNLSREEFAAAIDLQRTSIYLIETGKRNASERTINSICQQFDVNKDWLLTGEGEVFVQLTEDDEFSRLIGMLLAEDDNFKKRIIKTMLELDDSEWIAIRNIVKKFAPK